MLSSALAVVQRRAAVAAGRGGVGRLIVRHKSYTAPLRDMRFLIHEVYDFENHYKSLPKTTAVPIDTMDTMLEAAAKFSEQVLFPLLTTADTEGCKHTDAHTVTTPPGFKAAYDQFVEGEWQAVALPEMYGGHGLPHSLSFFVSEMLATANFTWSMYPGLTRGFMNTLMAHGSDALKQKYMPALATGKILGTMCLTEPQCGSDLAQVNTQAKPQGDGSYLVTGTKIFISCGEHDLTENILHCVLARLPDAPPGTKGISLFLVPKRVVGDGDEAKEYNNVNIGRIENKMGCHGSSTCEINFNGAVGYLIGEPNRGLNHMFTFINTSRMGTALQGTAAAELSFQNALAYAKERLAMRSLTGAKCPDKPADPIIVHPDIRRMLLTQKAVAEGGRAMLYHCAKLNDVQQTATASGNHKLARKMDDRLGFLTPILKGFLTELGVEAANLGIQVWGGHGYIRDNMMEQILRDVRIAPVWEGTTGIQALDLLARKLMLQKLMPLHHFASEVERHCWATLLGRTPGGIRSHATTLLRHTVQWRWLTMRVAASAIRNKDALGLASVDYLMYSGYVTMAYTWLRQAEVAKSKLPAAQGSDREFYRTKMQTADFYYQRILPRTRSLATLIKTSPQLVMAIPEDNMAIPT